MDNNVIQLFLQNLGSANFSWMVYLLAFLGGVISSLSPCSLGLLPVIVGYVGSQQGSKNANFKSVIQIIFFVLGLALTLTIVGVIAAMTGKVFGSHSSPYWALIMASVILIFGLDLLKIIEIPIPSIVKQMPKNTNNNLVFYPMLIGAVFAFATTPCSTPILAAILAYTSLKANIAAAALLMFIFSLGQSSILVIAGLFTTLFKKILKVNAVSEYFLKFSGLVLVIAAIILYLKVFEVF